VTEIDGIFGATQKKQNKIWINLKVHFCQFGWKFFSSKIGTEIGEGGH
jgi:hypothetical protein